MVIDIQDQCTLREWQGTDLKDDMFTENMFDTRDLIFSLVLSKLNGLRAVNDCAVGCEFWYMG